MIKPENEVPPRVQPDGVVGDATPTGAPQTSRGMTGKWLLRLALGLTLLAYLIHRGDGEKFAAALKRVPLWVPVVAGAWYLGGQVLSAWKWRLLLKAGGADVPLRQCCALYWLGMFSNLWLPSSIGGDAVRVWRLRQMGVGGGLATASVLVERLTGFGALLLLGGCGLVLAQAGARISTLLLVCLFAIITIPIGFLLLRGVVRARLENLKFGRKLLSVADAVAIYGTPSGRGTLVAAMVISLLFQASQILLGIGLARAVGLMVPAAMLIWLVPLLALASLVPVGIGGLGVREAAAVTLVGSIAPAEVVIAWSLLWQATVWISSLPGAFALGGKGRD